MLSGCMFLADRSTAAMAPCLASVASRRLIGFVIFRI
jgi:hypothetical protein